MKHKYVCDDCELIFESSYDPRKEFYGMHVCVCETCTDTAEYQRQLQAEGGI